jgi:dTDP-4-amino-4,6-dideoxygalactose transaminase
MTRRLAILGGAPAFSEPLHVGRPNIANRDQFLAKVGEILDSRWLTNNGKQVKELESRIARYVGARHCIAVCNATIGLELLIRALRLRGEVVVPSFTFVATAHALQWQGTAPVFADIDPKTHCIDPASVESLITPSTSGIIGVHVWGEPCATDALQDIAQRHGIELIFDAAHAFGCASNGKMVGTFGRAEVFSFHATKFFNTFEGGAIVTDDDALAGRLRLMQNFGFAGYDNVVLLGTNGKMTEVCAAMGLANFAALPEIVAHNLENYRDYRRRLESLPGINLKPVREDTARNYQYIVTLVDEDRFGLARDELVEVLHAENVIARRYFFPGVHNMEPYRSIQARRSALVHTEALCRDVLVLPTGTAVSATEIARVCEILHRAREDAPLVRARLTALRAGPEARH